MAGNAANQILILEDDETQSKALSEAFKREGFIVHVTNQPSSAEEILQQNRISTMIVDCLLPGISGVEFVEKIRGRYSPDALDVILMSGLFTDPGFIKESIRATHAKHFLRKPFELSDILGLVDKFEVASAVPTLRDSPRKNLYELFRNGRRSPEDLLKILTLIPEVSGFDLPFIYAAIVESKAHGILTLSLPDTGDQFRVTFTQGTINNIEVTDKDSYLGKILLDGGFVHPDDLQVAFENKAAGKIGEKLINNFFVSPHALNIALSRQINIRLSKTIMDKKMRLIFTTADVEHSPSAITTKEFDLFMHDWITSKIDNNWLKSQFLALSSYTFIKTPILQPAHQGLQVPLLTLMPNLVSVIVSGQTLSQVVDSKKFDEDSLYKALHFLLARGLITVGKTDIELNPAERLKFFQKISAQFQNRPISKVYEVMARMTGVGREDADLVFEEFKKIIGDKPGDQQRELLDFYKKIISMATQAQDFGKSNLNKSDVGNMNTGAMEKKVEASNTLEEARNHLEKNSFKKALDLLKKAQEIDPGLEKVKLHIIWAQAGIAETSPKKNEYIKKLETEMNQIPAEEKFDAVYNFVLGLIAKVKGNYPEAKQMFEKAYHMDKKMIIVKRELTMLVSLVEGKKDVFNKDLRDIVGSFFKK